MVGIFSRGFSSTVRQMAGNIRRQQSLDIICHQTLLCRAVLIEFTIQAFILLLPSGRFYSAADLRNWAQIASYTEWKGNTVPSF